MKSGYCTIRWNGRDCGTNKMNHCQSYQSLVFIQRRWCAFGEIGSPLLWASSRRPIISNKYCSKLDQIKAALGKKYPKLVNRKHLIFYHACVISHFSHVWLCNPMNCKPPGSSVHGILQARILEWVAMPSSRGSSWPRDRTHIFYVSCIGRQVLYH